MGDCCEDELCEACISKEEGIFISTFHFDKHRITIHGCSEAVGEVETVLGEMFKGRIPKLESKEM